MNKRMKATINGRPVPDRNEEYLFYQTLLGAWPMPQPDSDGLEEFVRRIRQYMLKAVREAKVNTDWLNPDTGYEDALSNFVGRVIGSERFRTDLETMREKVSHFGMFNSLSQVLLKITSPGVPDFYQGTELWNLSLVDPDNRTPVDYGAMKSTLAELKGLEEDLGPLGLAQELVGTREDGRIKMYLTFKALGFRRDNPELFMKGQYVPLHASGGWADNVIAFARTHAGKEAVTVVPRLVCSLTGGTLGLPLSGAWGDTRLGVPAENAGGVYRDVFTGRKMEIESNDNGVSLPLCEALSDFPVSLLERIR
jgi:(1->4)-alpha-D-glucan 1-alpha-D-glucosylmutase